MKKKTVMGLLLVAWASVLVLAGVILVKQLMWVAYDAGAMRGSLYTLEHRKLPSWAFRKISFERPKATDDQIEAEAEIRYPMQPGK